MPEKGDGRPDLTPVGRAINRLKNFGQPKVDAAYRFMYTVPGVKQGIDKGVGSGFLKGPEEVREGTQTQSEVIRHQVDEYKYALEQQRIAELRQRLAKAQ